MSNHPRPVITADIIIWKYIIGDTFGMDYVEVLLIKRGKDPFKDHFAFPGGHFDVDTDESILHAAHRELEEETGLVNHELHYFGYYDAKGRDPRGRYVDFVYSAEVRTKPVAVAADDAADAQWFRFQLFDKEENVFPPLAFDHHQILVEFLQSL